MPYMKRKKGDQICVYKKGADGEPEGKALGCHESEDDADAQIAAEYANEGKSVDLSTEGVVMTTANTSETTTSSYTINEPESVAKTEELEVEEKEGNEESSYKFHPLAIKAVEVGDDVYLHSYAVIWGDEKHKDLQGEFFTKKTQELTAIFDAMGAIPYLPEHGADDVAGVVPVAKVIDMGEDDIGLWWKAKVIEHQRYRQFVQPLIERDSLFTSSGTLPAAKRVRHNGEITRWPIAELTGTTTPAEFRMLNLPIEELKGHYKSIGIDFEYERVEADSGPNDAEKARKRLELRQRQLYLQLQQIS